MWSKGEILRPMRWLPLGAPPARGGPDETPAAAPAEDVLARARREAERLLAAARTERDALRAAVTAEAQAERERARCEGLAQGRAEGWAEARAESRGLLRAARQQRRHARAERQAVLTALEAEIAGLAFAVARQVLDRELEQTPDEVVGLLRRLLSRTHGSVRAHAHPSVAPVLEAEAAASGISLAVVADAAVAPGGLVLDTADGLLDATVDGRLERVRAALQAGMPHGR